MTRWDTDSMSERIHREYRYHPDAHRRYHAKYGAVMMIPILAAAAAISYYYHEGRGIWHADPQFLLNMLRQQDTSPRSKLYWHSPADNTALPAHVAQHRDAKRVAQQGMSGVWGAR